MGLKGSKTEKNILTAFAGESQARNRYTYAANKARKEGYRQISEMIEKTADQEREHAKRLFKFLEGGEIEIAAAFPAGIIGDTVANLKAAAAGEHYEHTTMYPEFAKTAREEGLDTVAAVFESIAVAEKQHEKQFNELCANVEGGTVFKKSSTVKWTCLNCGYVHEGPAALEACPACAHAQAHFAVLAENW
jgi:rubrerythrin